MSRALPLILLALLVMAFPSASAQTGGIQIAPIMVTFSGAQNIATIRIRNGRAQAVAFEVDAFSWTQSATAQDELTPTSDLLAAPGVFEIAANSEQVLRVGVRAPPGARERAYRLLLRELPRPRGDGVLGFALEMSLPVFVADRNVRPNLRTYVEMRDGVRTLVLLNAGAAHTQLSSLQDAADGATLPVPRYLLSGSSFAIALPPRIQALRLRAGDGDGSQVERIIHVEQTDLVSSAR